MRTGLVAAAVAVIVTGCGFHLAGTATHLPKAMRVTYIASSQPYGYLANLLRRAIEASDRGVTEDRTQATAILDITKEQEEERVVAVDSRGRPQEYLLTYRLQYALRGPSGRNLVKPATITLLRHLAYSTSIELGVGQRRTELLHDMQREASQLVLLHLEAPGARVVAPPAAS